MGQKATWRHSRATSSLPPKADIPAFLYRPETLRERDPKKLIPPLDRLAFMARREGR
jgi:hypothetical protein